MEKDRIKNQSRMLKRLNKELAPLKKQESEARRLWTIGYKQFLNADNKLSLRIKNGLTVDPINKDGKTIQLVKKLWDIKDGWKEKSRTLTEKRDAARRAIDEKKAEIALSEKELEKLISDYQLQLQKTDSVIDNVFLLNDGVVSALENMDKFLSTDIFPLLEDVSTQKTIENSTSTKKIVIMTNNINWMDAEKAMEAKKLINDFFDRINPKNDEKTNDTTIQMLSSLLKELLVVKIKTKAGPNLSKFLYMDIDKTRFPELVKAQKLLASATNYVRSGKYIRIYIRENKDEKWQSVRQS